MSKPGSILSTIAFSLAAIFSLQTIVPRAAAGPQNPQAARPGAENVEKLLSDSDCRSCHSVDHKVVGPSYSDIAKKYASQANAAEKLARSIREGGSGSWGTLAMPPHPDLKDAQLGEIVQWVLAAKDGAAAPGPEAAAREYTYTVNGKTVTADFPVFAEGNSQWVTKDIFHGYQLYNSYCYRCHGQDATQSELAPDLKRFIGSGTMKTVLPEFLSVVMAGREDKGMPSWAGFLNEEEVRHLYEYVKGRSLELVPVGRPLSEYDSEKR